MLNLFDVSEKNEGIPLIKQLRELKLADLVPVRETLNSIDFIFGDDDIWEYSKKTACTKVRLYDAEKLKYLFEVKTIASVVSSTAYSLISLITKVHKITLEGKNEAQLRNLDKEEYCEAKKKEILEDIKNNIALFNLLLSRG